LNDVQNPNMKMEVGLLIAQAHVGIRANSSKSVFI
jgi:hypothetical protein